MLRSRRDAAAIAEAWMVSGASSLAVEHCERGVVAELWGALRSQAEAAAGDLEVGAEGPGRRLRDHIGVLDRVLVDLRDKRRAIRLLPLHDEHVHDGHALLARLLPQVVELALRRLLEVSREEAV